MTVFNPWAEFNISGQFICETFGLIAPAMPQSAARIGLNYTTVTIDGEPAQTTQLFTTMIARAFLTDDIDELLDAGLAAIDPACVIRQIVLDVRKWHSQYPRDWRKTRDLLKNKHSKYNGATRDRNGYELNTGSTIAALLYGQGDFVRTLITAFNFGWDADNTAATSGTIVGVTKGYRWMLAQGWQIVDRYHNTTRDNMPNDETITSFADRLIDLAEKLIREQGGGRSTKNGSVIYHISSQAPKCIRPLDRRARKTEMRSQIDQLISGGASREQRARGAYLAICLDLAESMREKNPRQWTQALDALNDYPNVVQAIFHHYPAPQGDFISKKAEAAGLKKPPAKKRLW
jgi:hypothetical protein